MKKDNVWNILKHNLDRISFNHIPLESGGNFTSDDNIISITKNLNWILKNPDGDSQKSLKFSTSLRILKNLFENHKESLWES